MGLAGSMELGQKQKKSQESAKTAKVLIPSATLPNSALRSVASGLVTIGFDHPSTELLHCSVPSLGPVLVGFKINYKPSYE